MIQRAIVALLLAIVVSNPVDLAACGDKFLRVGRSARYQHYAAVHPASILIYSPATASRQGIQDFEKLLKRAGHTPYVVAHGTAIRPTLAGDRFDLVIAAYADADWLEHELAAIPSRPHVLPILYKPTPEVAATAARAYHHVLEINAITKAAALAEIDEVMAARQNGVRAGAK
jgi:hypothetical protein